MNIYDVTQKSDGVQVTSYSHQTVITDGPYPLDAYDHTLRPETGEVVRAVTVYQGRRRLTKLEFRALFTPAEQQAIDKFEAHFETMPFQEDVKDRIRTGVVKRREATVMDLDERDLLTGLGLHVALSNLAYSRISEILNG